MYHVDIHNWSSSPMLILLLGHVSPCLYSHLVMYPCVDILTWLYIPIIIFWLSVYFVLWFTLGHVVLLLIVTLFYISMSIHSPFMKYSQVDVHSLSCIDMLILTFVHVGHYCSSHLVICPHVDIHTCSCIPMLIFILGHIFDIHTSS